MTDDRIDGPSGESAGFQDALSTLGDDTRLTILVELADVAGEEGMGAGLSFSELRERVGVADSGRFNYHLGRLDDRFVTKVGDEYVARYPALAVAAALYAGEYGDAEGERTVAEATFSCPECSRPVEVRYGRDTLYSGATTVCPEHGTLDSYPVPPGARPGRSPEELVEIAYRRSRVTSRLARRGICAECWGPVSVEFPVEVGDGEAAGGGAGTDGSSADGRGPDVDPAVAERFLWVRVDCRRCWNRQHATFRGVMLTDPRAAALFRDGGHGPFEAVQRVTGRSGSGECESEVVGTDPVRATVRYAVGDDRVELTVDDRLRVVEVAR